jgi:hypothetical protein
MDQKNKIENDISFQNQGFKNKLYYIWMYILTKLCAFCQYINKPAKLKTNNTDSTKVKHI